jgi:hypothetical protein
MDYDDLKREKEVSANIESALTLLLVLGAATKFSNGAVALERFPRAIGHS